jgi:pilus assembly protein CpaF
VTAALKSRVHAHLLGELDDGASADLPLAERVEELVRQEAPLLAPAAVDELVGQVLADVQGLGPLEPFVRDDEVTELMVNGGGEVWIERRGRLCRTPLVMAAGDVRHIIEKVVAPLGLRIDRSSPLVDARLADGSRVNAVVPPLAVDGPCLTIRRFGARAVQLAAFTVPEVGALLQWAVRSGLNVLVAGGTGAGKTTLLNALAGSIPAGERIVTVEDAAELRLPNAHVVRLEARPANAEGAGAVSVRDLVRNALRMRPDRIVVGEVRGPEALDMLQAMNTGHEGSLSTCHANSPADALRRLETMVLMGDVALPLVAVREQVHAALDLIVQVSRLADGGRAITEVAEVCQPSDAAEGARIRPLATSRAVLAWPARPPRRVVRS